MYATIADNGTETPRFVLPPNTNQIDRWSNRVDSTIKIVANFCHGSHVCWLTGYYRTAMTRYFIYLFITIINRFRAIYNEKRAINIGNV